jgi:predicted phosphodiesterase
MNKLRFAVISDLHCHPIRGNSKENSTLLFTDLLRTNTKEHPVENLKEVVAADEISNVDFLLCPGDLSDHADRQGLISGWDFTKEIASIFGTEVVYATLGNHDVDSRHKYNEYSYHLPKGIKKEFPFEDPTVESFWSKGYTFIERYNLRMLIINSSHYHTHNLDKAIENPTIKGKIDSGDIHEIKKYLQAQTDDKIKIMLCHHHPVQHSQLKLGEHDFIENGQELINTLAECNFDLVVHGHKHNPWFEEHTATSGKKIPILSCGSFSATDQVLFARKTNYFHIIDIEKSTTNVLCSINTWNFSPSVGWTKKKDGFFPVTGFGVKDSANCILEEIKSHLELGKPKKWDEITAVLPKLNNLLPSQLLEIEIKSGDYKIMIKPSIMDNPTTLILHE